jgi:hypothetical protein
MKSYKWLSQRLNDSYFRENQKELAVKGHFVSKIGNSGRKKTNPCSNNLNLTSQFTKKLNCERFVQSKRRIAESF